jgi:hypothetical protein
MVPWTVVLTGMAVALAAADGLSVQDPGEVVVFVDSFEPDTIPAWETNQGLAEAATDIVHQGSACLKLTDQGINAQVFLPLNVIPGLRYRVRVQAYRHGSNTGDWLGCAAVSFQGGRGSSSSYVSRSGFLAVPDQWCELSLEFEARTRRAFLILVGQNATGDVTRFDDLRVTCVGVPPLTPVCRRPPEIASASTGVELTGSPLQIGRRWGALNARAIADDLEEYYSAPAEKAGLPRVELIRRSEKFVSLARDLAPHWLDEAQAVAQAAGVEPELYLAFVGSVYRSIPSVKRRLSSPATGRRSTSSSRSAMPA